MSTGVDARNVRNIVLLRPVNNIIEFKQIVGRGTRLFDNKNFFTIYDFVNASDRFKDPEWDGEPVEPIETDPKPPPEYKEPQEPIPAGDGPGDYGEPKVKVRIKLATGKEFTITHDISTIFIGPDGKPMTVPLVVGELPADLAAGGGRASGPDAAPVKGDALGLNVRELSGFW